MKQIYVYIKSIKTGREVLAKICDNWKYAIEHIALCYKIDKDNHMLGEYYYIAKER